MLGFRFLQIFHVQYIQLNLYYAFNLQLSRFLTKIDDFSNCPRFSTENNILRN